MGSPMIAVAMLGVARAPARREASARRDGPSWLRRAMAWMAGWTKK